MNLDLKSNGANELESFQLVSVSPNGTVTPVNHNLKADFLQNAYGSNANRVESSVPIQVLNLGDGAAFIPIGATSPFFQISSGHGNSNSISAESLSVAASNGTITNLVNSQQTTHSGAITLSAQQYEQLTNNQGNGIIELMPATSESSNSSNHLIETSAHINNEASTSRLTTNGNLRDNTPDNRSQQRASNTITEPAGEEPIYVNAKQYDRILIRRAARARLEAQGRLPKERRVAFIFFTNFLHYRNTCTSLAIVTLFRGLEAGTGNIKMVLVIQHPIKVKKIQITYEALYPLYRVVDDHNIL